MTIIGIDLGTTLNKIGCFNPYGLRIIINNNKNPATPSAAFAEKNRWTFGEKAVKNGISKPKQCIYETKLMLGRKFSDKFIQERRKLWKFETKADENDNIKIVIKIDGQNKEYYAYEILGLILKNLVEVANINLPAKTSQVVISIPTSFQQKQLEDLKKATQVAELQVLMFITDPISASLSYLHNIRSNIVKKPTLLIYDIGTSSINVSIIKTNDKNAEILNNNYDDLNGQKFEENIYDYITKKIDFDIDKKTELKLRISCKEAKTFLSEVDTTDIIVEDDDDEEKNIEVTITEAEFNEINAQLFDDAMKPVTDLMNKEHITKESIDQLFLVGGSAYMKNIRKKLKELIGKEPCPVTDPRECIALGACLAGATLSVDEIFKLKKKWGNKIQKKFFIPKSRFFDDLEIFSKFDKPLLISIGSHEETIIQENQQIPCIIERTIKLDEEINQISFLKNDKQNILYKANLETPISGTIDLTIQITYNTEESKIEFDVTINKNRIQFSLSNPSAPIIYKEYINQLEKECAEDFNKAHCNDDFMNDLSPLSLDSIFGKSISNSVDSFNSSVNSNDQNPLYSQSITKMYFLNKLTQEDMNEKNHQEQNNKKDQTQKNQTDKDKLKQEESNHNTQTDKNKLKQEEATHNTQTDKQDQNHNTQTDKQDQNHNTQTDKDKLKQEEATQKAQTDIKDQTQMKQTDKNKQKQEELKQKEQNIPNEINQTNHSHPNPEDDNSPTKKIQIKVPRTTSRSSTSNTEDQKPKQPINKPDPNNAQNHNSKEKVDPKSKKQNEVKPALYKKPQSTKAALNEMGEPYIKVNVQNIVFNPNDSNTNAQKHKKEKPPPNNQQAHMSQKLRSNDANQHASSKKNQNGIDPDQLPNRNSNYLIKSESPRRHDKK